MAPPKADHVFSRLFLSTSCREILQPKYSRPVLFKRTETQYLANHKLQQLATKQYRLTTEGFVTPVNTVNQSITSGFQGNAMISTRKFFSSRTFWKREE